MTERKKIVLISAGGVAFLWFFLVFINYYVYRERVECNHPIPQAALDQLGLSFPKGITACGWSKQGDCGGSFRVTTTPGALCLASFGLVGCASPADAAAETQLGMMLREHWGTLNGSSSSDGGRSVGFQRGDNTVHISFSQHDEETTGFVQVTNCSVLAGK
jgi:hypothetical protein